MNIFGRLFGSDKVIDGAISGIDKAFYTKEEQAESLERRIALKVKLLQAYEAFKIAQRFLAMLYGIPYVSAWFITFAASFFVDVERQMDYLVNSDMAMANLIILGFYFLGGAGESIMKYKVPRVKVPNNDR